MTLVAARIKTVGGGDASVDMSEWLRYGFDDPEEVAEWLDHGIDPDQASFLRSEGIDPTRAVEALLAD